MRFRLHADTDQYKIDQNARNIASLDSENDAFVTASSSTTFTNKLMSYDQLTGVPARAPADWNETDDTSIAFIRNKPDVATLASTVATNSSNISSLQTQVGGLTTTYDTTIADSVTTTNDVGALSAGTQASTLKGETITSILDLMLFPTIVPVRASNGSVSFNNLPTLVKCGDTYNTALNFTINSGSVTLNGIAVTSNDGLYLGLISAGTVAMFGGSSQSLTVNSSQRNFQNFSISGTTWATPPQTNGVYTAASASTTSTLTVTFLAAASLQDNKGNNYDNGTDLPARAQTLSSSRTTVSVFPFYIGNQSGGNAEVSALYNDPAAVSFNQNFAETSSARHRILVPKPLIDIGRTYKLQMINTVSGNYEDVAMSNFTMTNYVTVSSVQYREYKHTGPQIATSTNSYKLVRS